MVGTNTSTNEKHKAISQGGGYCVTHYHGTLLSQRVVSETMIFKDIYYVRTICVLNLDNIRPRGG